MKPPIVVITADASAWVFDSVAEAESHAESIDVENGEYQAAFDSAGLRLQHRVEGRTKVHSFGPIKSYSMAPVKIEPVEAVPSGANELKGALRDCLGDAAPADASLDELIDAVRREKRR